jgi:hypothetical protein
LPSTGPFGPFHRRFVSEAGVVWANLATTRSFAGCHPSADVAHPSTHVAQSVLRSQSPVAPSSQAAHSRLRKKEPAATLVYAQSSQAFRNSISPLVPFVFATGLLQPITSHICPSVISSPKLEPHHPSTSQNLHLSNTTTRDFFFAPIDLPPVTVEAQCLSSPSRFISLLFSSFLETTNLLIPPLRPLICFYLSLCNIPSAQRHLQKFVWNVFRAATTSTTSQFTRHLTQKASSSRRSSL